MKVAIYACQNYTGIGEISTENQINVCREFAAAYNYEIVAEFAKSYKNDNTRPGTELVRMVNECRQGKFQAVLVYSYDRISSIESEVAIFRLHLAQMGIEIISVNELSFSDPVIDFLYSMTAYYLGVMHDKHFLPIALKQVLMPENISAEHTTSEPSSSGHNTNT